MTVIKDGDVLGGDYRVGDLPPSATAWIHEASVYHAPTEDAKRQHKVLAFRPQQPNGEVLINILAESPILQWNPVGEIFAFQIESDLLHTITYIGSGTEFFLEVSRTGHQRIIYC